MILGKIRHYLKKHKTVSLYDVATHFDIDPDTAKFALHYWQNKGKVRALGSGDSGCGSSCSSGGCGSSTSAEQYEWIEQGIGLKWFSPKRFN